MPTPTTLPPALDTAVMTWRIEPPVVVMSSTMRTLSLGSILKPRRKARSFPIFSAKIPRTPNCLATSYARIMPPVVGPATTWILFLRKWSATIRQSCVVYSGCCRMRNFSQYIGECTPEVRRKCPFSMAPDFSRISSAVLMELPSFFPSYVIFPLVHFSCSPRE